MTFTRLADEFLEDETIGGLSDRAYRLFVSGLVYCSRNLTDGLITPKGIRVIEAILGYKVKRYIAELVAAGLWIPLPDDSHKVRNYLKFNKDSGTVKEDRRKARERMQKLRGSGERSGEHNAERSDARSATPSLPSLSLVSTTPLPTSYEAPTNGHFEQSLWERLLAACRVKTKTDADKLVRCVRSRKSTESDIARAIEAATGKGVRDPLAVALSELSKRGAA